MGDRATGVVDQRQRGTDRLGVGRQERRRCTPVGEREQHHMVEVAGDPGERRDDRSVEVERRTHCGRNAGQASYGGETSPQRRGIDGVGRHDLDHTSAPS